MGSLTPEACRRLACDGALTRVLVTRQPEANGHHPDHHPHGDHDKGDLAARLQMAMALLPPVLGGAPSQPLDVGRASRVITPAQRSALAVRDGGCVFPDCHRPLAWCEGHHLVHWLDGGPTDLANLALLCRAHHRVVHEGGWQLTRGPDGRFTATPPPDRPSSHRRHPTAA
jgi:HNH endonuclease